MFISTYICVFILFVEINAHIVTHHWRKACSKNNAIRVPLATFINYSTENQMLLVLVRSLNRTISYSLQKYCQENLNNCGSNISSVYVTIGVEPSQSLSSSYIETIKGCSLVSKMFPFGLGDNAMSDVHFFIEPSTILPGSSSGPTNTRNVSSKPTTTAVHIDVSIPGPFTDIQTGGTGSTETHPAGPSSGTSTHDGGAKNISRQTVEPFNTTMSSSSFKQNGSIGVWNRTTESILDSTGHHKDNISRSYSTSRTQETKMAPPSENARSTKETTMHPSTRTHIPGNITQEPVCIKSKRTCCCPAHIQGSGSPMFYINKVKKFGHIYAYYSRKWHFLRKIFGYSTSMAIDTQSCRVFWNDNTQIARACLTNQKRRQIITKVIKPPLWIQVDKTTPFVLIGVRAGTNMFVRMRTDGREKTILVTTDRLPLLAVLDTASSLCYSAFRSMPTEVSVTVVRMKYTDKPPVALEEVTTLKVDGSLTYSPEWSLVFGCSRNHRGVLAYNVKTKRTSHFSLKSTEDCRQVGYSSNNLYVMTKFKVIAYGRRLKEKWRLNVDPKDNDEPESYLIFA